MRYLILLLIASLACAGDAKPKPLPLPLETQAELARSEKNMAAIKADYLKKANEELLRLTYALQDQMKKMTQAGDLEGALILRDKIAEVGRGEMITVNSQGVDLPGKTILPQRLVGRWNHPSGCVILYHPNNTMEMVFKGKTVDKGKWMAQDTTVIMHWDERGKRTWEYEAQTDTMKTERLQVLNRLKS